MFAKPTYLNRVALIESEQEPKRPNIPAAMFNRSPLRDHENKNISNISPTRTHQGLPTSSKKSFVSPYRRRQSQVNHSRVQASRRKIMEPACDNHPDRVAKFYTEGQQEMLYYCEKCAIQLASKGFKVERLGNPMEQSEFNPRKKELDEFVSKIKLLLSGLEQKRGNVKKIIEKGQLGLEQEIARVEEYYSQFYEIIDEHKSRVLEELSEQFQSEAKYSRAYAQQIENAIMDSETMKNEIIELEGDILAADENKFRPIMNMHQEKYENYAELSTKMEQPINIKHLSFNDADQACQTIIKCLNIEWQEPSEQKIPQVSSQSDILSQQSTTRNENPIEYLEKEQPEQNSNIKALGNLFSSFDE